MDPDPQASRPTAAEVKRTASARRARRGVHVPECVQNHWQERRRRRKRKSMILMQRPYSFRKIIDWTDDYVDQFDISNQDHDVPQEYEIDVDVFLGLKPVETANQLADQPRTEIASHFSRQRRRVGEDASVAESVRSDASTSLSHKRKSLTSPSQASATKRKKAAATSTIAPVVLPPRSPPDDITAQILNDTSSTELANPKADMAYWTDWMTLIVMQMKPCWAKAKDLTSRGKKKHASRVYVGYCGFACTHCGQCRSFCSNPDNLPSAITNTLVPHWSHPNKCPALPTHIRQALMASQKAHKKQRNSLPYGAQRRGFQILWKRLRSLDKPSTETRMDDDASEFGSFAKEFEETALLSFVKEGDKAETEPTAEHGSPM